MTLNMENIDPNLLFSSAAFGAASSAEELYSKIVEFNKLTNGEKINTLITNAFIYRVGYGDHLYNAYRDFVKVKKNPTVEQIIEIINIGATLLSRCSKSVRFKMLAATQIQYDISLKEMIEKHIEAENIANAAIVKAFISSKVS
jgi:hypothetical protein